jgi:acetyl-CoA/propionyl-CoA carboxylase, biotin carboxylase, biotin carboxyl carrier protein
MAEMAPHAGTIRRLLVANRGEIALRVFRTCRRLGTETVAVVGPGDGAALHGRSADAAVEIASYLDAGEIVRAAAESGADAVHPGYGFLAESASFAEAVVAAGLTWVGPPAAALRLGGDKLQAKRIAAAAGVPTLPEGDARMIGFPLLVKAAAGGGGRGMRIVRGPADLDEALETAAREAEAAFGDGTTFCERYLERPRHVEVQLIADARGALSLGLRDCSVQRRHQKVVEESPPPGLADALGRSIEAAAVAFADAIGYRGAGTAEFLVSGEELFFLELNGRIQVEHPVTESVTGLDLVELQLRVACGEELDLVVARHGHAVEARLYAEDPRTFLPQGGALQRLSFPAGIRVDAGVEEGDEVGVAYDPMIAKLIAHGADRAEALDRLAGALDATVVEGVVTNLPFLRWLVAHPAFRAGGVSTSFLTDFPPLSAPPLRLPTGPFAEPWRLNLPAPELHARPDVDGAAHGHAAEGGGTVVAPMPGTVVGVRVAPGDVVTARQHLVVLEAMKMELPVTAPFDGTVAAVHVAPGDRVAGGAVLVELEWAP